ncbi:Mediator of RNA polymerase II transcription subunit 6 [Phlyctema vagabunda]|uniref:Mediator of RNA polymerase II transcription subunit 6 n=1 Tax=Phlyctema vagabunda TaxID=108571 RepID=A0ABR4PGD3_9HELO
MASQEPLLDEIQWKSYDRLAEVGGIHSNTVLFYFSYSPFFDPTSNNAVLFNQAMFNQNMLHVVQTREAFEGRLKTMSGLEFIVAQEPAEMAPNTGTGVWVIRKQTRRKRPGQEDELTVHTTYFVVGDNIYMAPTVADVVGNRMLSIISSLNKFMSTAATLPNFTPSLGHTYMPPTANRLKTNESQVSQASKENTPLPDALAGTKKTLNAQSGEASNTLSNRLLEESLNISLRYGDEYMDENPITGQPGEFHLSSTGRKEKDKLMVPQTGKAQPPDKITIPPPSINAKTDSPTVKKGGKGDKSPRTPGVPKPKRRKSKPLLSGGVSPS